MKALITDRFSLGPAGGVGMINGGGAGTGNVLMQVFTIGGVHTFSPTFLMDGTAAVSRDPLDLVPPDSNTAFGLNVLGIPGTNGPSPRYNGIPGFSIGGGYEPLGTAETYLPKYERNTYYTYSLNFGWMKGQHDIRFGLDVARIQLNEWHPERGGGPIGSFTFDGSVTLPGSGSPNQFNNYAAFLLGLPQTISKTIEPDWMAPRQWMEGYYFRDRWRVNDKLTLTLGLRWEYSPIMTYANYGMVRFDASAGNVLIGGLDRFPMTPAIRQARRNSRRVRSGLPAGNQNGAAQRVWHQRGPAGAGGANAFLVPEHCSSELLRQYALRPVRSDCQWYSADPLSRHQQWSCTFAEADFNCQPAAGPL